MKKMTRVVAAGLVFVLSNTSTANAACNVRQCEECLNRVGQESMADYERLKREREALSNTDAEFRTEDQKKNEDYWRSGMMQVDIRKRRDQKNAKCAQENECRIHRSPQATRCMDPH